MSTITLWLLVSLGSNSYAGSPHQVVERFASMQECKRVADILSSERFRSSVQCIQATVVRP